MTERPPFFDAEYLVTEDRYVVWLDVMGTGSLLTRSLKTAANFIFKLHVASLETPHDGIHLYPMNDGVFAVGENLEAIRRWLKGSFLRINLANQAVNSDQTKIFMVRASVAYGPVAEGPKVQDGASDALRDNAAIRDAVLVGAPVVNAYLSERNICPFGIYVHESARTFAPRDTRPWSRGPFMRYWVQAQKPTWVSDIEICITGYLDYCKAHSNEIDYTNESISQHEILTREFFDY